MDHATLVDLAAPDLIASIFEEYKALNLGASTPIQVGIL